MLSESTAFLYNNKAHQAIQVIEVKSEVLATINRVNVKVDKVKTKVSEIKTDVARLKTLMRIIEVY